MDKVYCSECKYIKMNHGYEYIRCIHKDNICDMKQIDWLYRDETIVCNNWPKDLNYSNDCTWYEEK